MSRSAALSAASTAAQTSTRGSSPDSKAVPARIPTLAEWRAKMRREGKLTATGTPNSTPQRSTSHLHNSTPAPNSPLSTSLSNDGKVDQASKSVEVIDLLNSSSNSSSQSNGDPPHSSLTREKADQLASIPRPAKRAHDELDPSSPGTSQAAAPVRYGFGRGPRPKMRVLGGRRC